MCPQRFVPSSYDSEKLLVLQQAFDEALNLIADAVKTEELSEELAKAIVTHATDGIIDADELRDLSLRSLRERGLVS